MGKHTFETILSAFALTGAAACWLYALTLAGPVGRNRLTFGLLAYLHRGRHTANAVQTDILDLREARQPVVYEGETVRLGRLPDELERMAAYEQMRSDGLAEAIPVSSQPLVAFAEALHPSDLEQLQATLDGIEREMHRRLTQSIDAALAAFLADHTRELALVT
jgi:hypothetical protein